MAVNTSKAIKKPAPKMTKKEMEKMSKDLAKLKYDKPNIQKKKGK